MTTTQRDKAAPMPGHQVTGASSIQSFRKYRNLAGVLVVGCVGWTAASLAQDDSSDPLSMPYQDEEVPAAADADADEPGAPATAAEADEVDFFDTLDFLDEGKTGADGENIDLEALPGVAVTGGKIDQTPGWDIAVFRGLDKVTARVWKFEAAINQPVIFEQFEINVRRCNKQPPEDPPNTTAFVQVDELRLNEDRARVFSGWMFASSPGLNAVEHPVYDVWLIDCKMAEVSASVGIDENVEAAAESDSVPATSSFTIAD